MLRSTSWSSVRRSGGWTAVRGRSWSPLSPLLTAPRPGAPSLTRRTSVACSGSVRRARPTCELKIQMDKTGFLFSQLKAYTHVWFFCRYECAFGTAFDPVTRSCIWVSKVPSCSAGADLRADSTEVRLSATNHKPPFCTLTNHRSSNARLRMALSPSIPTPMTAASSTSASAASPGTRPAWPAWCSLTVTLFTGSREAMPLTFETYESCYLDILNLKRCLKSCVWVWWIIFNYCKTIMSSDAIW